MGRFGHPFVGVTKRYGTEPHAILDVLPAFNVPRVTTSASHQVGCAGYRELVIAFSVGMSAARNGSVKPWPQSLGYMRCHKFAVHSSQLVGFQFATREDCGGPQLQRRGRLKANRQATESLSGLSGSVSLSDSITDAETLGLLAKSARTGASHSS
jgi:hypothetical protein